MTYYMIIGFALAVASGIIAIVNIKVKKDRLLSFSFILSMYAILVLIFAFLTKDPIEGIPTEVISLLTSAPFVGLVAWYAKDVRSNVKKIPVIETRIGIIEMLTSKIPEIDKRLETHIAVCDEREKYKRRK